MIELERTFLVKALPTDLAACPSKEMLDIYLPASSDHPILRIRKNGAKYEMTKKAPVQGTDSSEMLEQTIPLTEEEFTELAQIPGKRVQKRRYVYVYEGNEGEIDVFEGELKGLVLADFEFSEVDAKNGFSMPEFCLADVTQEKFLAGGMLCGKAYQDITADLARYNYSPLQV